MPNIIVIDDDESYRDYLTLLLARAGYKVRSLASSRLFGAAIAAERFDAQGNLTDEKTRELIRQLLHNLMNWTERIQQPQGTTLVLEFPQGQRGVGKQLVDAIQNEHTAPTAGPAPAES